MTNDDYSADWELGDVIPIDLDDDDAMTMRSTATTMQATRRAERAPGRPDQLGASRARRRS